MVDDVDNLAFERHSASSFYFRQPSISTFDMKHSCRVCHLPWYLVRRFQTTLHNPLLWVYFGVGMHHWPNLEVQNQFDAEFWIYKVLNTCFSRVRERMKYFIAEAIWSLYFMRDICKTHPDLTTPGQDCKIWFSPFSVHWCASRFGHPDIFSAKNLHSDKSYNSNIYMLFDSSKILMP